MNCARCHTDWPRDRMFTRGGKKYCSLCWRVMIYPRKVGETGIRILDQPNESILQQELREDPNPHPWRYQSKEPSASQKV